jgi:monofunctional biosynthetic peptidoglycan transglycosylase
MAAILPLPKKRGAVAPKGFTRRYGNSISARLGVVARDGLDACVYRSGAASHDAPEPALPKVPGKARPQSAQPTRLEPLPGEEYEQPQSAPEPAETPAVEPPPPPAPPVASNQQ